MNKKKIALSAVATLALATNLFSEDLTSITITSPSIKTTELEAPYSTEVYTKEDIEKSKSQDVYDFLNSQTSVAVSPSYGNTFSQLIDLRGYGLGDGYENVVISVNGRRLNNIDMVPQLLSSIPVESIEKIEIIKGSGSVQYGDGANAGAINIITNGKNDNYIKTYFGSNSTKGSALSLGYSNEQFIINGYLDYVSFDGSRETTSNEYGKNYNRNKYINLTYFPTNNLELRLGRNYSNMNIFYSGSISLDSYENNPHRASTNFTEHYYSSYVTTAGLTYNFNSDYSIDINFSDEDKISNYTNTSSGFDFISESDYDYKSFNSSFNINKDKFKIVLGVDRFKGDRSSSSDTTTKENKAIFTSIDYFINKDLTLSTGARKEKIEYNYSPDSASSISEEYSLNAYELGINYKLDEHSSIFANYNKSYQAPAIDRLFNWDGTFNGLIKPVKVNNYSIGYSNIQSNNKFKASVFRSNLKNEIYLEPFSYNNTNIDKSHKYGIELFDKYIINKNFYTSINYSYIISKIDSEDDGNGAYDGKKLPGVSKHNVTVNLAYIYKNFNTILSHTYRSSAYAANDFGNNFSQKQEAYNSTDLSVTYTYENIELFAKVKNLFDEDNGIWIRDDAIYPVNFERTFYAGLKYSF